MRNGSAKTAAEKNSRELHSLTSNFTKVRILHYAAAGPIGRSALLLRLRAHHPAITPGSLNRLLASMARLGWLKITAPPAYSLTPNGRRALKPARDALQDLVTRSGTSAS
jgi:hypothetical protein